MTTQRLGGAMTNEPTKTPVERGAEGIASEYDRRGHLNPGTWWSAEHRRGLLLDEARAVFASIDREGLAAELTRIGIDERQSNNVVIADVNRLTEAILAYLTGGES